MESGTSLAGLWGTQANRPGEADIRAETVLTWPAGYGAGGAGPVWGLVGAGENRQLFTPALTDDKVPRA